MKGGKNVKKKLLFAVLLATIALLTVGGTAMAADPTDVNVNWSGSGGVSGGIVAGNDADAAFDTAGNSISGSFSATDSNDNPYGYGVDSFKACFNGSVSNGYMNAWANRNDSKTSMYGPAGQHSWSYVGTDGDASMAYRTTTNYAQMRDCSFGYQLPGGHNVTVAGATSYLIDRGILDGRGNMGYVLATGDGSATLDCMSAEASGGWDLKLGHGCGCYTDANFNATGTSGYFEATGIGNNNVTFHGLGASSGGGTLSFIANWVNSFSIGDYSLSAN